VLHDSRQQLLRKLCKFATHSAEQRQHHPTVPTFSTISIIVGAIRLQLYQYQLSNLTTTDRLTAAVLLLLVLAVVLRCCRCWRYSSAVGPGWLLAVSQPAQPREPWPAARPNGFVQRGSWEFDSTVAGRTVIKQPQHMPPLS